MPKDEDANTRRKASGAAGGASRSERGSPKQDSAERAAQHKYRAKIHNLLEELQRLVRPKEELASGKRLRNGQMSKTSILTHATKIVRKILLDDEVLAIAKKIEDKDRAGHRPTGQSEACQAAAAHRETIHVGHRVDAAHILSQQSQSDFKIPAHRDSVTVAADFQTGLQTGLEHNSPKTDDLDPIVSVSELAIDSGHQPRSKLWESVESDFFLKNWVGTVSPNSSDGEGTGGMTVKSFHLVCELGSPDECVPQMSLVAPGHTFA